MKAFTRQSLFTLATVALLSACSRPYATFQKTTPEHFYTKTKAAPAVVMPTTGIEGSVATQPTDVVAADVIVPATPVTVDAELQKVEALASTKVGLASNKKLSRHLMRVREMMTEVGTKPAAPVSAAGIAVASIAPQRMNLMQRLVTKSIDKKIHKALAPKKPMAKSILSIGIIIALIGVLLLLVGTGTVYSLGYVGLIVGIILIIASLL